MDTSRGMTWSQLEAFLAEQGFVTIEHNPFEGLDNPQQQIIAAHVPLKLLLHADSCNFGGSTTVNGCTVYGVARRRPGIGYEAFVEVMSDSCDSYPLEERPSDTVAITMRHTRPVVAMLAQIASVAGFVNWNMPEPNGGWTPYLFHFGADPGSIDGVRSRFRAFVATCPPEVREFITSPA